MGDWGVDNLQEVVVLNWGGGGGGIQVDLKKIHFVSVNWHNFDQMLMHMLYSYINIVVIFMYFWY